MMTFSSIGSGYQTAGAILEDWRNSSGLDIGGGLKNFGLSLLSAISSPFAQTGISNISRGAGTYFGLQANTFSENSYGNLSNTGFQSGFQGVGILQGSFSGQCGYYSIYDRLSAGRISPFQAYTAIGVHAVGLGLKAALTKGSAFFGGWLAGGPTVGTAYAAGYVTGAIAGGYISSVIIDRIEKEIFRHM